MLINKKLGVIVTHEGAIFDVAVVTGETAAVVVLLSFFRLMNAVVVHLPKACRFASLYIVKHSEMIDNVRS